MVATALADWQWLAKSVECELAEIAYWWRDNALALQGFVGHISNDGLVDANAEKSAILNTRILWFFSAAAKARPELSVTPLAMHAFDYLKAHFWDSKDGGFYWSLHADGSASNTKKQTYAQAFGIYALSAYYELTGSEEALAMAMQIFHCIESHCLDDIAGGYIEALDKRWQPLADMRLSEKDANAPKSMNTHLHVLEAYTALFGVVKTEEVKLALRKNILWMGENIYNPLSQHLRLFMDMRWRDQSEHYSFGHDVEASWLLYEALNTLGDEILTQRFNPAVLNLVERCLEDGIGSEGQVLDWQRIQGGERSTISEWWIQAEAMVAFVNAWQLTGKQHYLEAAERVWQFIIEHHKDAVGGEWFWADLKNNPQAPPFYKVGFWKGPYHNGRAMLQVAERLRSDAFIDKPLKAP